jgi:hypothetical protein
MLSGSAGCDRAFRALVESISFVAWDSFFLRFNGVSLVMSPLK